jgi:hypothetical protein
MIIITIQPWCNESPPTTTEIAPKVKREMNLATKRGDKSNLWARPRWARV